MTQEFFLTILGVEILILVGVLIAGAAALLFRAIKDI